MKALQAREKHNNQKRFLLLICLVLLKGKEHPNLGRFSYDRETSNFILSLDWHNAF